MTVFSPARTRFRKPTAARLRELRAALEQQRAFRTEQLVELDRSPRALVADSRDEVIDVLRGGAMKALHDTERALARMDVGDYGSCESCGGPIPLERLEILPAAAHCMPCARRQHPGATAGAG